MTVVEKTLKNVLKSGVVNDDVVNDVKWYYGKLKNNNYGFVFHIVVNNKNLGSIIPVYKNIINDNNFNDFLNESINVFKKQYKFTMENK